MGEACSTGRIRSSDLPEEYALIDSQGFEYFDVIEVDLDTYSIQIGMYNEDGSPMLDEHGVEKILKIQSPNPLKAIPRSLLSNGN